jgi:hypothetical protein
VFDAHYLVPRLLAEGSWFFQRFAELSTPPTADLLAQVRRATFHGSARDEDVPKLMRRAKICLGVNQRSGKVGERFGIADSRLRDFEAPLSGAFYLVQYFPDLTSFYRAGVEVETWTTPGELVDKIRYYLPREEERRAIAARGQARAQREHTWDARLSSLLHVMRLAPRGSGNTFDQPLCPLNVLANISKRGWDANWPACRPTDPQLAGTTPLMNELIKQMG